MFQTPVALTTDNAIGQGRVALALEYDGAAYHGWQKQKSGVPSVEEELVRAVSKVANEPVELVCAGRTDAGVHGSYQLVHFDTNAVRDLRSWVMGINTALPPSIVVHWAGNTPEPFHARFSAVYRRYRYVIFNGPVRPALLARQLSWTFRPLDEKAMQEGARQLEGEHDFSSFRAAGCQSRSPWRFVEFVRVCRRGDFVVIDVQANAFLHHMVRNFAGALMAVGQGKYPPQWVAEVLAGKDRRMAGITAPAAGLYLVDVGYPAEFGIPRASCGPAFVRPWFEDDQNAPIAPSWVHRKTPLSS
ncbi:tRNA pseudouridine38-40 synthase [Marinobacter segnicrescens]|uniref:tRNA pseudouridine synthase A n=1 Tax=Marinobacter segnicrescens TaxID=430453 RepID=A0A1I0CZM1_9GAMM|nr:MULTISPECIES: tRNA pseudouridine(38-40) synthase TruA [Marinobacter]UZD67529.1 tRNA pseudouridine(38-40) synthase TruA [Marinobacter sp. AN1]SET25344.1 tRNA pseudouridine38-40 synthase [Marinobacter segnicrescens]